MSFNLTATNHNGIDGAEPPNNTVQEGDSFDLKLSANLSELEYSWFDDEKDIVGDKPRALLGHKVALNADGNIVAVAAAGYITADGSDKTDGYVEVYENVNGQWVRRGDKVADIDSFKDITKNRDGECTIAINDAGTILAIGEPYYDRGSVTTYQKDFGRVRLYQYTAENGWELKETKLGLSPYDHLGKSISMNSEGDRLIIGIPGEASQYSGTGAAEIYDISNFNFTSQLGQKIKGEDPWVKTGSAVSMNNDGNKIAVATEGYDDATLGDNVGKVDLYELSGGLWVLMGQSIIGEYGQIQETDPTGDFSGETLSLSGDGSRVAIGSQFNDGDGDGDTNSGHVRIYQYSSGDWSQLGDDIDGEYAKDKSSVSLSLNNDGSRVAIGSTINQGARGHVRIYEYSGGNWNQLGADIDGDALKTRLGHAVSLNGDGDKIAIGDRPGKIDGGTSIGKGTISFYSYRNDIVRFSALGAVNQYDIRIDDVNTLKGKFVLDPETESDSIRIDIEEDISNVEPNEVLTFRLDDYANITLGLTIEDPQNKSASIVIVDGDNSNVTQTGVTINETTNNQIWFRVTPAGNYGNNERIPIAISDSSQFINPITSVFTVSDGDPLSPVWFSLTAKEDRATEGSRSIDVATGETTDGATNKVNFSINDTSIAPKVNSITFDKPSVNEDKSITVTLSLNNVFEGDRIPVNLTSSSPNINWPGDIDSIIPTEFVVDNNLSASITLDIKKDDSIEIEAETITVTLGNVLTASDGTTYNLDSNSVLSKSFVINPSTFTLSSSRSYVNERSTDNTIDIILTTTFAKTGLSKSVPFVLTSADEFINPPTEFSLNTNLDNVTGDFESATSTITLTPKDDRETEGDVIVTLTLHPNFGGESISFRLVDNSTDASAEFSPATKQSDLYRALGSQIDFKIDTYNYSADEELTIKVDTTVQDSVSAADIDGPLIQTLNTVLDPASEGEGSVTGSIQTVASRFQHKSKVLKLDLITDGLVRDSIQIRLYNDAVIKSSAIRGIANSAHENEHVDVLLQASSYYDENDVLSYRYSLKDSGGNNIPVSSNLFHKSDEDYKDINHYNRRVYSTLNEFRKSRDTIYIKDGILDEYGQGVNINLNLDNTDVFEQRGFDITDYFQNMTKGGTSVSLNGNGNILAVGVPLAKPSGGVASRGKTIIFEYIEEKGTWSQLGSDIDGESNYDQSGYSISLNEAGNIIAIGAYLNDGNGDKSGHVRVFKYSNGNWNQLGIDINGEASEDQSGFSVSLSDSGYRVAIGAYRNDESLEKLNDGHVRIYEYSGGNWNQLGDDIDGEAQNDQSGYSVSLSGDGNRVAIGAHRNDGIGNDSGHVRIYEYSGSAWSQLGDDIDGEAAGDQSGISVSLNEDGDIVAIGAHFNKGSEDIYRSGHVKVYQYSEGSWTQLGSDIDSNVYQARFGRSVSLSADGRTLAVGGPLNDAEKPKEAQVKIFKFLDNDWYRIGQTIFSTQKGDLEGTSVSLSSDGNVVALGAPNFDSDSTTDSGLVRVFEYKNTNLPLDYGITASAAYSLRSLGENQADITINDSSDERDGETGKFVVQVRRNVDAATKSFTADEVADGTMEQWVEGWELYTPSTKTLRDEPYWDLIPTDNQNFQIISNNADSDSASWRQVRLVNSQDLRVGKNLVTFDVTVNSGTLSTGYTTSSLSLYGRDGSHDGNTSDIKQLSEGFNSHILETVDNAFGWVTDIFFSSGPSSKFDVTISNLKVYKSTVNELPLDQATGASAAYSLRNLSSTGTDVTTSGDTDGDDTGKYVVQVRRSSDDAVQSFTAGEVNDGTLESWVGAGNDGHVRTWYDQSVNKNHATQADPTKQPKIVEGGNLVERNGNPAVKSTSNNRLDFTLDSLSSDGQQSVFAVLENDVTLQTGYSFVFGAISNSDGSLGRNRRPYWFVAPNGTLTFSVDSLGGYVNSDREYRLYSHIMNDDAGGTSTVNKDGTQVDTRSITLDANSTFSYGRIAQVGANATGALYMSEVIYYPSDQADKRRAIEENIANHYDITLGAFSRDGTVSTWYDQSGSVNHATQTDATKQPKIVDGGSVLKDSAGKPEIDFDGTSYRFDIDFGSNLPQPNSIFMVHQSDSVLEADNEFFDEKDITGQRTLLDVTTSGSERRYRMLAKTSLNSTNIQVTTDKNLVSAVYNGSNSSLSLNGDLFNFTNTVGSDSIAQLSSIGFSEGTGNYYDGTMQEFIIYNSDQSDNCVNIEANIANHYNINLYN